jgi:hypothetical protein
MESYTYHQFPAFVYVALYINVCNSPILRQRIIKASTLCGEQGNHEREAVSFAFIDPRLVCFINLRVHHRIDISARSLASCTFKLRYIRQS